MIQEQSYRARSLKMLKGASVISPNVNQKARLDLFSFVGRDGDLFKVDFPIAPKTARQEDGNDDPNIRECADMRASLSNITEPSTSTR